MQGASNKEKSHTTFKIFGFIEIYIDLQIFRDLFDDYNIYIELRFLGHVTLICYHLFSYHVIFQFYGTSIEPVLLKIYEDLYSCL